MVFIHVYSRSSTTLQNWTTSIGVGEVAIAPWNNQRQHLLLPHQELCLRQGAQGWDHQVWPGQQAMPSIRCGLDWCVYVYIYLFIYIHVYMICVCECVSGIYVFENGGRICILWNVINYIKHWKRLSNMYLIVSIKFLKKIFSYEDGSRSSYVMEMYFNLMKQVIQ